MRLSHLIHHPEDMNKETLYELRTLLAQYPYHQAARLLLLKNLYLLHDSSFDDELRAAAIHITDRERLFEMVESVHHRWKDAPKHIEAVKEERKKHSGVKPSAKRVPNSADATIDYVAYLLESGAGDEQDVPAMAGQELIDQFISQSDSKPTLKDEPEYTPQISAKSEDKSGDGGYFTETLAKIYIKQGRYSKALEIIKRLNLNYPKKSVYFADQIRFLERLITINNNK